MRDGRIRLLAAVPPRAEDLPLFSSIAASWPFLGCLAKNAQKGERRACDVRREGKKTTSSVNDEKATTGLMAQRLDTTRKRGEENQKKGNKKCNKKRIDGKRRKAVTASGPFFPSHFLKTFRLAEFSPVTNRGDYIAAVDLLFFGIFFKFYFACWRCYNRMKRIIPVETATQRIMTSDQYRTDWQRHHVTDRFNFSHTKRSIHNEQKRMT